MRYLKEVILMFAVALSLGCNKDGGRPEGAGVAIAFDIVDVQQTKAAVASADEILSLGILGYSTGAEGFNVASPNPLYTPNLFFNRHATRLATPAGGLWSYNPPAYWPIDEGINNTFFAYSPHSSMFPVEAAVEVVSLWGNSLVTYTVPQAVEDQVDLLYSQMEAGKNLDINKSTKNGKVLYQMKHALSWIKFYVVPVSVYPSSGNEKYAITSLTLNSLSLITRATLNIGTGIWTAPAVGQGAYYFTVDETPIGIGKVADVAAAGNALMLIPQQMQGAVANISFSYFDGQDWDPDAYFFAIPLPDAALVAGLIRVFVLRINTDGVTILFHTDNTIEKWLEDHSLDEDLVVDVY